MKVIAGSRGLEVCSMDDGILFRDRTPPLLDQRVQSWIVATILLPEQPKQSRPITHGCAKSSIFVWMALVGLTQFR